MECEARCSGTPVALSLGGEAVQVLRLRDGKPRACARLADVYGVERIGVTLVLYWAPQRKARRTTKSLRLVFRDEGTAEQWRAALTPEPRRILFLVNPFGGTRKAVPTMRKVVAPMVRVSHVIPTVIHTTHAGHAREVAAELDLSAYDGVVTVSGDGLLNEVVTGLLGRPDRQAARRMPLGVIPCGTGNGLAVSFGVRDAVAATLCVIKGHHIPLDLMSARQEGRDIAWSFLMFAWGLVADIDIESERFRWAGDARFTLSGVTRLFNLRAYRARLDYLPVAAADDGWRSVEADFHSVLAMNVAWQSADTFFGPHASPNDGAIDLSWIERQPGVRTRELVPLFLDLSKGNHMHKPYQKYVKVRAFALTPLGPRHGIYDLDGEVIPSVPTTFEVHPSLLNVMAPAGVHFPPWPADQLPQHGLNIDEPQRRQTSILPP